MKKKILLFFLISNLMDFKLNFFILKTNINIYITLNLFRRKYLHFKQQRNTFIFKKYHIQKSFNKNLIAKNYFV